MLQALGAAAVAALLRGAAAAGLGAPGEPSFAGPVFVAGQGGYKSFRIPGIIAADAAGCRRNSSAAPASPVLVMVAEGRKYGCDDFDGQHDIVVKRSFDGGRVWGALQTVADPAAQFNCTLGDLMMPRCEFWDPTILYDSVSCDVLIMSAYGSGNASYRGGGHQDIFLFRSSDFGATFSAPRNLSTMLSKEKGASYHVSTANGHGMQIRSPSPWAGRLIVPAYGVVPTFQGPGGPWGSSVYYSDVRLRCGLLSAMRWLAATNLTRVGVASRITASHGTRVPTSAPALQKVRSCKYRGTLAVTC